MGILIGLTGKTGAGKSTAAAILKEHGVYVIDGDRTAREVLGDPEVSASLKDAFGADLFGADGALNRKLLAARAFSSPEKTAELNRIMHPAICAKIFAEAENALKTFPAVVVDAAALIESGFAEKCDRLIVAEADEKTRLARIRERDGISREEALLRIRAQKPDSFYEKNADLVIHGTSFSRLEAELAPFLKEILD